MTTLFEVLSAEPLANINFQVGKVLYGTYDPEDGSGVHTGWFYNGPGNPNTGFYFTGESSESGAQGVSDTLLTEAGYKRVVPWRCVCDDPYASSKCYMV